MHHALQTKGPAIQQLCARVQSVLTTPSSFLGWVIYSSIDIRQHKLK